MAPRHINARFSRELAPRVARKRITTVKYVFILIALAATAKLGYLQIFKIQEFRALADNTQLKKWLIPAKRGRIYIKDGNSEYSSAMNETVKLFYIDPTFIKDKNAFAKTLSPITGISVKELYGKANQKSAYVVVAKEVNNEQAGKIQKLDMPGLVLEDVPKRVYPEGRFMSHLLGFVTSDGSGKYGIEEQLNNVLSGTPGLVRAKTDKNGVPILTQDNIARDPVSGSDVHLTIDRAIQQQVELALRQSVKKFRAKGGSVMIMEPKTGKILALANAPDFNPNFYYKEKDYTRFENVSFSRVYEPGSVFKIFTMAAGLNENKITPSTKYKDSGKLHIDDHYIMNSDRKAHGTNTMSQALEKSLNTGTTWVLEQLGGGKITRAGKDIFYKYMKDFGFGTKTGVETTLEANGYISKPKDVSNHTYATMSFGQSIAVTPVQLTQAVAAIANDGVMMKPYLIDKTITANGKVTETKPVEVRRIISKEAAVQLQNMMVGVVKRGHGQRAGVKGYRVAGKTGTAQIPNPRGGYLMHANIGTFVGFAPAEDPQFVMIVKIDRPQVAWAESSAAPVFGDLSAFLVRYLAIAPGKI